MRSQQIEGQHTVGLARDDGGINGFHRDAQLHAQRLQEALLINKAFVQRGFAEAVTARLLPLVDDVGELFIGNVAQFDQQLAKTLFVLLK